MGNIHGGHPIAKIQSAAIVLTTCRGKQSCSVKVGNTGDRHYGSRTDGDKPLRANNHMSDHTLRFIYIEKRNICNILYRSLESAEIDHIVMYSVIYVNLLKNCRPHISPFSFSLSSNIPLFAL